jgi:hypothetical protein
LLWIPLLVYLFSAVAGRSERVRANLVGAAVIAPIFLGASYITGSIATVDAAKDFVAQSVLAPGAAGFHGIQQLVFSLQLGSSDQLAKDAIDGATLRGVTLGLGFGGRIGVAFVLIYTCLFAQRTGLLTRFWGSLGMAVGAILFFSPVFAVIWFGYMGLMIQGFLPGSRPPAWDAGKAVPWPTQGERMAAELDPSGKEDSAGEDDGAVPTTARELAETNPPRERGERRKRKQRD